MTSLVDRDKYLLRRVLHLHGPINQCREQNNYSSIPSFRLRSPRQARVAHKVWFGSMDNSRARGRSNAHRAHLPLPRAHQYAITTAKTYSTLTTPEAQDVMERLEDETQQERNSTPDAEIDVELMPWISDTGSTHARDTKYFHTIDFYWHLKKLLSKAITDKVVAHNELAKEMEYIQLQIQLLDKKFTIMAAKNNINFIATYKETHLVPWDDPPSSYV